MSAVEKVQPYLADRLAQNIQQRLAVQLQLETVFVRQLCKPVSVRRDMICFVIEQNQPPLFPEQAVYHPLNQYRLCKITATAFIRKSGSRFIQIVKPR